MKKVDIQKNGTLGYGSRTLYTIVLDQTILETTSENILVLHKKTPKVIASNTVGDGFYVPLLFQREAYTFELDKKCCIQGILSYHKFDEISGKNIQYAYKYPKSDLEDLNEIFEIWGLDVSAHTLGQHISLTSHTYTGPKPIENTQQLLSILFGMSLIYGDFHIVGDETLSHVRIDYPLIDSFLVLTETLQNQKSSCERSGLYRTIDIKEGKRGQQVQIDISDPEILHIYAHWMEINAYTPDMSIITSYIEEHQPHIYPLLSNSVLKLLKK